MMMHHRLRYVATLWSIVFLVDPSNGLPLANGESNDAVMAATVANNGSPAPGPGPGSGSGSAAEEPNLAVKKLCRLPSEAGTCSQAIRRFYYSPHSKHCLEFVYGGCQGNENNFDNVNDCETTCSGVQPCPYVPWVPGCNLSPKGEDSDGCMTYDMACEQKDKTTTTTTTTRSSTLRSSTTTTPTTTASTTTTTYSSSSISFSSQAKMEANNTSLSGGTVAANSLPEGRITGGGADEGKAAAVQQVLQTHTVDPEPQMGNSTTTDSNWTDHPISATTTLADEA